MFDFDGALFDYLAFVCRTLGLFGVWVLLPLGGTQLGLVVCSSAAAVVTACELVSCNNDPCRALVFEDDDEEEY